MWKILEILRKLHQSGVELIIGIKVFPHLRFLTLNNSQLKSRALYIANNNTWDSVFYWDEDL